MVVHQKTKTVSCKENGRSADITTGNFILGCMNSKGLSPCSYCYVARFGRNKVYINDNKDDILNSCNEWVSKQVWPKIPNQVDDKYYFADIGCSTDINMYWSKYDWIYVFDWFKSHPKLAATFATKFVNYNLLKYEPNSKIRVRMSLMPEHIRQIVETGTSPIVKRVQFLQKLYETGYSTHINLSPVIGYEGWLKDYKELFNLINDNVSSSFKEQCGLEIIMLTHNKDLHKFNIEKRPESETMLWKPDWQEDKVSEYGGNNLRYKLKLKSSMIERISELVKEDLSIPIRYIF